MEKLKLILVLALSLISALRVFSQVNQDWVQRYNGPANGIDEAYSVASDKEGNIFVTGLSVEPVSASGSFITIKYSPAGDTLWTKSFVNSTPLAYPRTPQLALDDFGNIYVVGTTLFNNIFYATTIKYNSTGNQIWQRSFPNTGSNTIKVDDSGNIYVSGMYSDLLSEQDFLIVKYDSSGTEQWSDIYDDDNNSLEFVNSIDVDKSGNVYITGACFPQTVYPYFLTIKYNSSGIKQWIQRYFSHDPDPYAEPYAIKADDSGNVFVSGLCSDSGATIKYNSSGVEQWVVKDEAGVSILTDGTGNIYCLGGDVDSLGVAIKKYGHSGSCLWSRIFEGGLSREAVMTMDNSGNLYTAFAKFSDIQEISYATVKLNSEGDSLWAQTYNDGTNSENYPYSIAVDDSWNVYVTGTTRTGTASDYITIKYSQTMTGVHPGTNEIANEFKLEQNYPNPFNPLTKINYELGVSNFVSLKVFNMLGKEVATLVNEKQNAGRYEVEFNASNLSSGVYFYRLETGSFSSTKRMTLIK